MVDMTLEPGQAIAGVPMTIQVFVSPSSADGGDGGDYGVVVGVVVGVDVVDVVWISRAWMIRSTMA